MKGVRKAAIVSILVTLGMGGSVFAFQEVRKAEARKACEAADAASIDGESFNQCLTALKRIPIKNLEIETVISQLEQAAPLVPLVEAFSAKGSETKPEAKPKAEPVAEVKTAPQKVESVAEVAVTSMPTPNFDTLSPCDQLDAIAKAGKSVSEFLVAAHRVGDLAKYENAINTTCPWNAEQLEVADRVINPPVIVVQPRVVHRAAPAPAPVPAPQPRVWNQGGPRIVPAEEVQEAWCYSPNPLDCPRNQNGNPWDNDLPELPRNRESETFEPLLHKGEF